MIKTGRIFIRILAIISIAAVLIPLFPNEGWYVRLFDFPRLQVFFLALISLFFFYVFDFRRRKRGRLLLGLLIATVLYEAYRIYPYTPFSSYQTLYTERDAGDTAKIKILVSNVLMENQAYHRLIQWVEALQPDVLLTLESDSAWLKGLEVLKKDYPHTVEVPLANTYGMLMHSRLPLRATQVRFLVEDDIPSIETEVRLNNGNWIKFYGIHPRPPAPTESSDSRERDAELVLIGREAKRQKQPVIVAGDFNDVAWSPTTRLFQEVSSLLDPRIGRGLFSTYHADYLLFRWPLDHIFHSDDFKLVSMDVLEDIGSDHFPIFVVLSYEPAEEYEQEVPQPDEDTNQEAQETIEEGMTDTDEE